MKDINLREYQAFETKDRSQTGMEIRRKNRAREALKYVDQHIMRLSPDATVLTITCYGMNVILTGRHLGDVYDAIRSEHVTWVQEFDAVRFDKPTDELAAVIEGVELFEPKKVGDE